MYEVKLQNGEIINAYEDEINQNYCGDYEAWWSHNFRKGKTMREKNVREINLTKKIFASLIRLALKIMWLLPSVPCCLMLISILEQLSKRIILGLALMYAGLLMDQSCWIPSAFLWWLLQTSCWLAFNGGRAGNHLR